MLALCISKADQIQQLANCIIVKRIFLHIPQYIFPFETRLHALGRIYTIYQDCSFPSLTHSSSSSQGFSLWIYHTLGTLLMFKSHQLMNFQKLNTQNIRVELCCYFVSLIHNPQKEVIMSLLPMSFLHTKKSTILSTK